MKSLFQDLRFGLRVLLNSPGFTAVAVLTLALGIAANTTVFSWIDTILVHPIQGASDTNRLVVLEIMTSGWNGGTVNASHDDYRFARENLKLLSGIALYTPTTFNLGEGGGAERVWGELVSGNYFAVLGVKPLLGRVFLPEEYTDKPGAFPVAVISERLWRNRFGADPGVVGKAVRVNRYPLTVVGVTPNDFRGTHPGLAYEMWVPLMMTPQLTGASERIFTNGSRNYWMIARLAPRVTIEQARAELLALVQRAIEANPDANDGLSATLLPVWLARRSGAQSLMRAPLQILMAVCVVLLLIVCANVGNLLLARSIARQKEFSIRVALGAGRGRLARQLLTEALLLSAMGALAAAPLAGVMGGSLRWLLPPTSVPLALDVRPSPDILAFTILICVATALLSGVPPVLQAIRPDVNETLKEGGRGGTSGARSQRLRGLLVVSEVALALVALVGAGLFVKSFRTASAIDPGFDPRDVSVAAFQPSTAGYSAEEGKVFCSQVAERLRSAPGVMGVAYSNMVPLGFGLSPWLEIEPEGYAATRGENMKIYYNAVSPGFFDVLRLPRVDGRDFSDQDDHGAAPVMIVNQSFARRFFGDMAPIGRRVRYWGEWATVVGVVKDMKYHSLAETPQPFFYLPFRQVYSRDWSVAWYVRGTGRADTAQAALRREAAAVDPGVTLVDAMPLTDYIGGCLFAQKVAATLLGALAALCLLLSAVGIYGVMSYSVSQRTHEIGIRVALGAQRWAVIGMVVRQGMALTVVGLAAGMAAAFAATRLVGSMLVNMSATDRVVFAGAPLFLATVALLASYFPARRATRVEPTLALRCE
ncbi:MAG TPA: ABC transporter permease [Vicinamibacteria bacterium]|nr:ABC transporter permease [Vicinamibacteria bacterium]